MDPSGPPTTAQYGSPGFPQRTAVTERSFPIALLLTIVTLGIYHFYWHYVTHNELCRQTGRPNEDKGLFWGYVVMKVAPLFVFIYFAIRYVALFESLDTGGEPTEEQMIALMLELLVFLLIAFVMTVIGYVLFGMYVSRQWRLLEEAKGRMGLDLRSSTGGFLGMYFGGIVGDFFIGVLSLILHPIAYYSFVENYNDIPRAITAHQVDPNEYAPGARGWTEGPREPARPGPAPVRMTYGYGQVPYGQPAQQQQQGYGAQPYQTPAYGAAGGATSPAPSQAPPSDSGYSIGQRSEAAPAGPPVVEQHFQCPRCHANVAARGAAGTQVRVHCQSCGESGDVRLPDSP